MLPVRPICDGDGDFFSPPIHILKFVCLPQYTRCSGGMSLLFPSLLSLFCFILFSFLCFLFSAGDMEFL